MIGHHQVTGEEWAVSVRNTVKATGVLPAGPHVFEPASPLPDGNGLWWTFYEFDNVAAQARVHVSESLVQFGSGGRSMYRNCTFDHIDFGLRGGGAHPGAARFEGCTFNYCDFRHFEADVADFIDCTFIGAITSAVFRGHALMPYNAPRANTFTGNDFTAAKLRRVEFQQLDLRSCRLPDGPEYLRIDGFLATAHKARSALAGWPTADREDAEWLLRLYEERWSEPFLRWRRALAGRDSPLWPLLASLARDT